MNIIINILKIIKNRLLTNNNVEEFESNEIESFLKSKFIDYKIINETEEKAIFKKEAFNFENEFSKEEIFLLHITNENSTIGIIDTNSIYGLDANKAAHFEVQCGSNNAYAKEGVILIFKWKGRQELTYAHTDSSNVSPNVLYHVSSFSSKLNLKHPTYWESRIYPNTNDGLELFAIKQYYHEIIILNIPLKINVIEKE